MESFSSPLLLAAEGTINARQRLAQQQLCASACLNTNLDPSVFHASPTRLSLRVRETQREDNTGE